MTIINTEIVSDYAAKPGLHASLARYFKSLEQHLSDLYVLSGGKIFLPPGTFTSNIMKDLILVYR